MTSNCDRLVKKCEDFPSGSGSKHPSSSRKLFWGKSMTTVFFFYANSSVEALIFTSHYALWGLVSLSLVSSSLITIPVGIF